jgi:hypothetical protein
MKNRWKYRSLLALPVAALCVGELSLRTTHAQFTGCDTVCGTAEYLDSDEIPWEECPSGSCFITTCSGTITNNQDPDCYWASTYYNNLWCYFAFCT